MIQHKRVLVTSALPYINGFKHLGNLVGSMLPADVYARFQRQELGDENVLFICATDEHGTPAELAARDEGKTVREYCDLWYDKQKDLYADFGLSFDHLGRSSSEQNHKLTQRFARTLWESGFIEERVTKQVYSRSDGRFLPDRYVVGTCPHCAYDRARGDQCENCTRLLDPSDLINPRSAVSGSTNIEFRNSKHLFLRQTAFDEDLRRWIDAKMNTWPRLVTSIALKWLDEGLKDRGITRDLQWGVDVNAHEWGTNPEGHAPDVEGLKGKVFYVWFDAPIEYIAATWEWADSQARARGADQSDDQDWLRWWKGGPAADVTYIQFMGKDNVPFHTVGFPCTIMGVNRGEPDAPWKLVDDLKGFNWLNYHSGKFSTSQQHGIFMDAALELLPADYWRWYLIANAPEGADASFTWEHFQATVNKDLADVLGNFVHRVLSFAANRFGAVVPDGGAWGDAEAQLVATLDERWRSYAGHLHDMEFRKAAAGLRAIWVLGNEYFDQAAPWKAFKTDSEKAAVAIRVSINLIRLFAIASAPVIPGVADRMLRMLRLEAKARRTSENIASELQAVPAGHSFNLPEPLFVKIEDAQVEQWMARFGSASKGPEQAAPAVRAAEPGR